MSEDRFDNFVRSTLGDAQEEVPADFWSAIESRLPAAGPVRKPVLAWWKAASGAVAAAAAVLLVVLFSTHRPSNPVDIVEGTQNTVAMVEPGLAAVDADAVQAAANVAAVENTERRRVSADTENVAGGQEMLRKDDSTAGEDVADMLPASAGETDVEEEILPGNGAAAEAGETETSEDIEEEDSGSWMDAYESAEFDENGEEGRERIHRGVSIAAYADAVSNTSSKQNSYSSLHKSPAIPKATTIVESTESRYGIPVSAGIGLRIPVSRRFSIGTGVTWSYLSRTFAGQYNRLDSDGVLISQESYTDIRNTQHYIGVPLNVNFSIISKDFIDFYAYASGSASYCLQNRFHMEPGVSFTPEGHNWQFSAGIGLGVEFIAAKRVGFYIDPSLNYWWTKGGVTNIRTRQPFSMGLEMGIRFHI